MKSGAIASLVLVLFAFNAVHAATVTFNTTGDYLKTGPKGLTVIVKALKAANLTSPLANFTGTVFMPSDDAFVAALDLMNVTEAELLSHPEALTALLMYHVSETVIPDLKAVKTVPVLLMKKTLNVTSTNATTYLVGDYNMARVIVNDMVVISNKNKTIAVLYTVDAVLVPDVPDASNSTDGSFPSPPVAKTMRDIPAPVASSPPPKTSSAASSAPASLLMLLAVVLAALL